MNRRHETIQPTAITLSPQANTGNGPGFIAYTRTCIGEMQEKGRYDAASKLNMYLRKFITYLGKNEIPFKDFDSLLIRNYHTWLKNQELGRNTVSLYIRNLKRVYQLAVADGVTCENHPFQGVDVSYRVKREKNRLTPKEVIRLCYLDTTGLHPSTLFARDLFLFALFAHGMTGGELFFLTKDNLIDNRLVYVSRATGKEETVRWNSFLQGIVDKYARPDSPYLFPVITAENPEEQWRQHSAAIHNINRNLKRIGNMIDLSFPLTLTVARHSWRIISKGLCISDLL